MSRMLGLWTLSVCVAVSLGGCKKKGGEESNVGPGPGPGCPPGQSWNGQMCVATAPPPPTATTTATTPPPPPPVPTGTTGPRAAPLDAQSAAVAGQALDALAKQNAPGAKAVGGTLLAGNFQQGQTLETTFNAQPGKCYTLVGAGLPNVQNLDLQLIAQSPLPGFGSPVLATDQTAAPNAVVAPHPNCWKWAAPMAAPLKVVMVVSAGSGMAAAQVYEK
ncbi:MAG: hypothetical protein IT375_12975 [Polyangiaceae bacterium]|nr:hypothetical protein [Polyangiaceae bacterium]